MQRHRVFLTLLIIVILALLVIASTCDNDNDGGPEEVTRTPAPPLADVSEGATLLPYAAEVMGNIYP